MSEDFTIPVPDDTDAFIFRHRGMIAGYGTVEITSDFRFIGDEPAVRVGIPWSGLEDMHYAWATESCFYWIDKVMVFRADFGGYYGEVLHGAGKTADDASRRQDTHAS